MEQQTPLTDEEKKQTQKKRADKFWNIFLFTDGKGKLKSTLLVNSFSLSLLFLAVYGLCYYFLIDIIQIGLGENAPVFLQNLLQCLVPCIIGTGACCSLFRLLKKKELVPAAYVWLILYALVMLIGTLVGMDAETRPFFLNFYMMIVPLPLALGTFLSFSMLKRFHKDNPPASEVKEKRAWER